jgi:hypothetical protein
LISGGEIKQESRAINTVQGVDGVDIGNRIEMYIDDTFGGQADVTVQIHRTIVGLPQTLSAGTRTYEVKTWNEPRDFTGDIARATFNKTRTIRVVQATEAISYTISRTVQSTQAKTEITNQTAGLEVGVENAVEAGGNVGIAEGKETIKINAKGTYNISVGSQNLTQTGDGYSETVVFNGYKIKASAPSITPLS